MWGSRGVSRGDKEGARAQHRGLGSGQPVDKPLRILIANTKGGCGKTTVAINLASLYAGSELRTVLIDHDPQGSSSRWLDTRSNLAPSIYGISPHRALGGVTRSFATRLPPDAQRVVLDAPAGVGGFPLADMLREVDVVLIPVLASVIDIDAARIFLNELNKLPRVRSGQVRVGVIANRVRENTKAYHLLDSFLEETGIPVVARLRDAQVYVQAAEDGVGVVEMKGRAVYHDRKAWRRLMQWVEEAVGSVTPQALHL